MFQLNRNKFNSDADENSLQDDLRSPPKNLVILLFSQRKFEVVKPNKNILDENEKDNHSRGDYKI